MSAQSPLGHAPARPGQPPKYNLMVYVNFIDPTLKFSLRETS